MKKNDILLIIAVAMYSYLFYAQTAGINVLLFTIILIVLLFIKKPLLASEKSRVVCIGGAILSGVCVAIYGNFLSVLTNIISLSLVANFSMEKSSSLLLSLLYSVYSYVSSVIFMAINLIERLQHSPEKGQVSYNRVFITIIPILITVIFFFIYRQANPVFSDFTKNINFNFITLSWVRFTFVGFVILYAVFYPQAIPYFMEKDKKASDGLLRERFITESTEQFSVYSNEHISSLMLFAMLNVLLLVVNILDINYLFLTSALPADITYSQFVHQGVEMLIISIVFAVGIILFYFRGKLNFYSNNKSLKVLAYLWVVQNAVLIITTITKNNLYINEYSLTYKRMGVYVYLVLCLIGLVTTLIKITKTKSNWFLFRKNGWAFYGILIISCFINWDLLITRYNIYYSKQKLDKYYLLSLSPSVLPDLMRIENDIEVSSLLKQKITDFTTDYDNKEWKSWNYESQRVYNSIQSH